MAQSPADSLIKLLSGDDSLQVQKDSSQLNSGISPWSYGPRTDFYVMANRQKYIGLTAYVKGVEYDSFTFNVTAPPTHGQLLGTAPNLCYVPAPNYLGRDSFSYQAQAGTAVFSRTVKLSIGTAYSPPLGIPPVPFGVNESNMMYVGATYSFNGKLEPYRDAGHGPYTHYVDFVHGTDTNNPFGTAALPRLTIPDNLPAGSVVELHGTNIVGSQNLFTISGEGTASKPIFIRGASPADKALFRRSFVVQGDYIICENLEFDCQDSSSSVWFWVTSTQHSPFRTFHHVAIRHSLFRDQPTTTIGNPCAVAANLVAFDPALDTPNLQIENIVAYDIEVRNFSQWNDYSGGQDYVGVLFGPNTRNCWALDCHLHHIHSTGVSVCRCNGSPHMTPPQNIYVGRNYIHNVKEQMVAFKYGVNCVCSQNVCHTVRASSSSVGAAIPILNDDATLDWPASDNIWIIFNTIYDSERGVYHENRPDLIPGGVLPPGRQSRSYMIGNTFFDIHTINGNPNSMGIAVYKADLTQSRIVNNLIRDCNEGFRLGLSTLATPQQCTQVVRNNIVTDLSVQSGEHDGCHFYLLPVTLWPYTTIGYNLHNQTQGRERFCLNFDLGIEHNYYSIADLQANTPFGFGCREGDPLFANVDALDFHLQATSPALGWGVRDLSYDLFTQQFGTSIDYYQDGTPRPNRAFDIGPLGVGP